MFHRHPRIVGGTKGYFHLRHQHIQTHFRQWYAQHFGGQFGFQFIVVRTWKHSKKEECNKVRMQQSKQKRPGQLQLQKKNEGVWQ